LAGRKKHSFEQTQSDKKRARWSKNEPDIVKSFFTKLQSRAFAPVDIASLVFSRIAFGLLMAWEVCRYFRNGWVFSHWFAVDQLRSNLS